MHPVSRREFLAASAGSLALSGCSRAPAGPKPLVSILPATQYAGDLAGELRRLIADHELDVRGKRVLLKPNLVEFDEATTINTHPFVVHAALEAFRAAGAAELRIAEGPGHRRNTLELAEAAGYFATVPQFESLFTDLNLEDVSLLKFPRPVSKLEALYLPSSALAYDLIVSMPKMKTHHWVGATLSMKNFFGMVPGAVYGWPKNILHWSGIPECIVDLHSVFTRHFAIVDGIVGMEGNGPIQGTPKPAGVIVAGSDLVAVDATCCRIMQIDPRKVPYLALAEERGETQEENVQQIGATIKQVSTQFELIPQFHSFRLNAIALT